MKVYVSVDMEGLAGISMWSEVTPRQSKESFEILYEHLKALLQGLFESGKVDYVLISDSHAAGDNIYYKITEEFENVEIAHGSLRKDFMMIGLDKSFDRVIFLGYHAGVGAKYGIMDHTYSSSVIHNFWINGQRMNEAIINAAFAGYHGVPLALVIGDNTLQKELQQSLKGEYLYVVTKESTGRFSAIMKPKSLVMRQIKEAAQRAVQIEKSKLPIVKFTPPIEMKIELKDTSFADAAELMPGLERLDSRTVVFKGDDYSVVFNAIMAIVFLAKAVKDIGG
ncbi:M55 family metallopeptidase [Thermotoga profunda]|uniref:M55 family metallopeptidase n=1 Tax=Thermotoga profunda TaxID=1508420 RepID=UPI0005973FAD|nr:M55 family metallopeptidase [Thermotoga profunda]